MKVVKIEQQGQEWLDWRKSGIGATDIVAIMNECPFRSAKDVFDDKMGISKPIFETDAMRMGKELEPIIRAHLSHIGYDVDPICVEDDKEPLFRASIDAYDVFEEALFEIKVSDKVYDMLERGEMPKNYEMQVQWQMMIVKPYNGYLVAYSPSKNKIIMKEVLKNEQLWQEMSSKAKEFWLMVENETYIDDRYIVKDDQELLQMLQADQELKILINHLEEQRKMNLKKIVERTSDTETVCGSYKLCRVSKPGSIDYSAIPELQNVDLNKYRKPSTVYWQVKEIN